MTEYRRAKIRGATYFFTVNGAERHGNYLLVDAIARLRGIFRHRRQLKLRFSYVAEPIGLAIGDQTVDPRW